MTIRETLPSSDLRDHVDAYWWTDDSSDGSSIRILPDGCADLVFDMVRGGAFVVGAMTRPLSTRASAGLLGIRFRPGRAALTLRTPLSLFTDTRELLREWTSLAEPLREAASVAARLTLVESVLRRALADAHPDHRVDGAVEAIVRSGGKASIEAVAAAVGVSRQHLGRSFAYHLGISPKTFARVVRFRRALALARRGREEWADLAAELGYFDQSHLIAEFREFAGQTPVPFFLSPGE